MIDKKGKIITLKSGKKYVIIEQCLLNSIPYYFACLLEGEQVSEEFKIITIYNDGVKEKMKIITNDEIIKKVCNVLDKMTD